MVNIVDQGVGQKDSCVVRPQSGLFVFIQRGYHAFKGLFLLKNPVEAIFHILGLNKQTVRYFLKNGLFFDAGFLRKDRTLILTLDEILNEGIYKLDTDPGKHLVVLDMGANVGVYSLYCSLNYDISKVYAFEPDPETFAQLENNIKINSLSDIIMPIKKAITGVDGQTVFYQDDESSRGSSTMRKFDKQFTVETLSLPGIFKELKIDRCDIAKIDIEGSEYPAILDCPKEVLQKTRIILVECHEDFAHSNSKYTKSEVRKCLEDAGFVIDRDEGLMLVGHLK